jgi:hypothetical protein
MNNQNFDLLAMGPIEKRPESRGSMTSIQVIPFIPYSSASKAFSQPELGNVFEIDVLLDSSVHSKKHASSECAPQGDRLETNSFVNKVQDNGEMENSSNQTLEVRAE